MPATVRRLGWISFFTDTASEMLYPLVPIFLTTTLGAPVAVLGLIEGIADGLATGLKAVAGYVADRLRRNRLLVVLGYSVSSLAKPALALAPGWGAVLGLRTLDRVGKAFRGVPRDLMIADAVSEDQRGRAFGLHRAMDTAGAVLGPLLAFAALAVVAGGDLRPVFLLAAVPGVATLTLLSRLPPDDTAPRVVDRSGTLPWRSPFGTYFVALIVFSIGNSSDVFLILRAQDLGLSHPQVVLAYALYNAIYAGTSLRAGTLADRLGKARVFRWGLGVFALVYVGFAVAPSAAWVWPLFAVYGLYMALTDGVGRALVVDLVPSSARGRALGVTQAASGGAVLVAGLGAGVLWQVVGAAAPFVLGAVLATVAWGVLGVAGGAGGSSPAKEERAPFRQNLPG